eukprot:gene14388-16980_t
MSSGSTCKDCGDDALVENTPEGVRVCTQCGNVLEEVCLAADSSYQPASSHGSASGKMTAAAKSYSSLSRDSQPSDATVKAVDHVAGILGIPHSQKQELHLMYRSAAPHFSSFAGQTKHLVASALAYVLFKRAKRPFSLRDISQRLGVNASDLGRLGSRISAAIGITIDHLEPVDFVERVASHYRDTITVEQLHTLRRLMTDLITVSEGYDLVAGRNPASIVGASAFMALSSIRGLTADIKEIGEILAVSHYSIRTRITELETRLSSHAKKTPMLSKLVNAKTLSKFIPVIVKDYLMSLAPSSTPATPSSPSTPPTPPTKPSEAQAESSGTEDEVEEVKAALVEKKETTPPKSSTKRQADKGGASLWKYRKLSNDVTSPPAFVSANYKKLLRRLKLIAAKQRLVAFLSNEGLDSTVDQPSIEVTSEDLEFMTKYKEFQSTKLTNEDFDIEKMLMNNVSDESIIEGSIDSDSIMVDKTCKAHPNLSSRVLSDNDIPGDQLDQYLRSDKEKETLEQLTLNDPLLPSTPLSSSSPSTPTTTSTPSTPSRPTTNESTIVPTNTTAPPTTPTTPTTTTAVAATESPLPTIPQTVQIAQPLNMAMLIKQSMTLDMPNSFSKPATQSDPTPDANGNLSLNQKKLKAEMEKKLVWLKGFDDHISKTKPIAYQPKGLVNTSNTCFMNVILQSLVGCQPFLKLLRNIAECEALPHSKYPTLLNLTQFNNDYFSTLPNNNKYITTPTPINPKYFNDLVKSFNSKVSPPSPSSSTSASIPLNVALTNKRKTKLMMFESIQQQQQQSCQQDAQEFLIYFLDLIHEELVSLIKEIEGPKEEKPVVQDELDGGEWEIVGQKNKTSTINDQSTANNNSSPVSQIFSGTLRSSVNRSESKESITLQPFYCLHLDIRPENIHTLDDALSLFQKEETLEGYTCQTKKVVITASKSMSVEVLPRILIIHFKRFAYDTEAQKLDKKISFPTNLQIKSHMAKLDGVPKRYTLFSVVSHHGKGLSQGHYTCDVLQANNQWFKFDDASITEVSEQDIQSREAYLLLYQQYQPPVL